jgi:hypothetical protein
MKVSTKGVVSSTARNNLTLIQKLAIVDRARIYGKKPTSRETGINLRQIHRWTKQQSQLLQLSHTRGVNDVVRKRLTGSGRPPMHTKEVESTLCEWFDFLRNEDTDAGPVKVNLTMCVSKLRTLDSSLNGVCRHLLRRRIWRIFRRRKITDRAVTHQMQRTRNCTEMIRCWSSYIREKMEMLGIGQESVCNFDETNVFFSPESKRTLARVGDSTIGALRADSSQRCSVMLGVTAGGHKFPPYIIYKGRNTNSGTINRQLRRVDAAGDSVDVVEGYPTTNRYAVQENAWMSSELMVDWINRVYRPWCATRDGPTMLIVDEFSGHMTAEVRAAVVDCGGFLEFIPGGYTWKLQTMDVGINKPFKDQVRDAYDHWFCDNNFNKKPQRDNIAQWVKSSFDNITQTTINKTWRKIGILLPTTLTSTISVQEKDKDDDDEDDDEELLMETLGIHELNEEETICEEYYNDNRQEE